MPKRIWKVAQISDTHIMAAHRKLCWWMAGSPALLLEAAIATVNQIPDLEAVLFTGDLVDQADAESLAQFGAIISRLRVPYYLLAGNHDIHEGVAQPWPQLSRSEFMSWCEGRFAFVAAPTGFADYLSYPKPGICLIGLDASLGPHPEPTGVLRDRQICWLAQCLAQHRDHLCVIMIHHPPVASWLYHRHHRLQPAYAQRLRALIRQHPQVAAVLSGHLHMPKVHAADGTAYLTAPGLIGPVSAFRVLEFAETQLRYTWQPVAPLRAAWQVTMLGYKSDREGCITLPKQIVNCSV